VQEPVVGVVARVEEDGWGFGKEETLPILATGDRTEWDGPDDGQPTIVVQDPTAEREIVPIGLQSGDVDSSQLQKDAHLTNGHPRKLFGLSFFATLLMLFLLLLPYL